MNISTKKSEVKNSSNLKDNKNDIKNNGNGNKKQLTIIMKIKKYQLIILQKIMKIVLQ